MLPLPFDAYSRAASLLQPFDFHLAVPNALQGRIPAQLYVDDLLHPRSAMLWVQHNFFLAGSAENPAFNEALHQLFEQTIFPAHPQDGFVLTWEDPAWEQSLQQTIMRDHPPIPGQRQYYALELDHITADMPPLPDGLRLHPVDRDLAAGSRFTNLDTLLEEMLSERPTVDAFLENSFGMCIISADRIITWCLSEYNLGERCEIGIATDPGYRERGLATLTGLAFLQQARASGIHSIGWHCWTRNQPSGKTALKIGLRKERDYPACFVLADRVAHFSVHGEIQLDQGAYSQAAVWFEHAFSFGEGPAWAVKNAACTYARLGDAATAFRWLAAALEKGWDPDDLEENPHLQSLRGTQQWSALMAQARKQA